MGGGDSLYDKIDRGVRGCDVMLSCVTTKYSLSANCRREVALADALRKPIIPLLLESMRWPPDGPMSLVLTPLLYIDFSASDAAAATSRDWKSAKFDELISKIDTHLQPSVTSVPGVAGDVCRTANNASTAVSSTPKSTKESTSDKKGGSSVNAGHKREIASAAVTTDTKQGTAEAETTQSTNADDASADSEMARRSAACTVL